MTDSTKPMPDDTITKAANILESDLRGLSGYAWNVKAPSIIKAAMAKVVENQRFADKAWIDELEKSLAAQCEQDAAMGDMQAELAHLKSRLAQRDEDVISEPSVAECAGRHDAVTAFEGGGDPKCYAHWAYKWANDDIVKAYEAAFDAEYAQRADIARLRKVERAAETAARAWRFGLAAEQQAAMRSLCQVTIDNREPTHDDEA